MRNSCSQSATVIVPAHNEEALIASCLDSVLNQDFSGAVRVVLVANGCSDRTAEVARTRMREFGERGWELCVVELEEAGKPAALNAAEPLCLEGARIHLDADVEVSENAISEVTRLLGGNSGVELAMPKRLIQTPRSWISRSYLRVWRELPRLQGTHVGSGFYAVSSVGRRRWGAFPLIISDDDFVKLQFAPGESGIAENATFTTRAPEGLLELARVRARWCRGTEQLRRLYPSLRARSEASRKGVLLNLFRRPRTWPHIPVFALVVLLAKWFAYPFRGAGVERWERAEQARRVAD